MLGQLEIRREGDRAADPTGDRGRDPFFGGPAYLGVDVILAVGARAAA